MHGSVGLSHGIYRVITNKSSGYERASAHLGVTMLAFMSQNHICIDTIPSESNGILQPIPLFMFQIIKPLSLTSNVEYEH